MCYWVRPWAVAVELRKEHAAVAAGRDDALERRALSLEVGLCREQTSEAARVLEVHEVGPLLHEQTADAGRWQRRHWLGLGLG